MNLRELLIKVGLDDSGTTEKLDKIDNAADRVRSSLLSVGDVLAGLGIGLAVQRLAALGDTLQNLQSRIDSASGEHIDGLFEKLADHASNARMDVEAYTDSWAKFESGMRVLGYGVDDTTKLTDTLSAAFRVNGTEAQTAAGALFQLTQSIGSGSVQMEELNSFMDASPELYRAVAESIGGTTTAFKKMVSQGKVSSKMLADAIIAQNKKVMEQLRKMPQTLGDIWTLIANDAKVAYKQMVVDTNIISDAAATLRDWWEAVRESWQKFVKSMGGAANVAASIKNILTPLATLLGILTGFKALSMLASPIGIILALAAAIGLLYDDYKVWQEGGTSLIDWQGWAKEVKEAKNLVDSMMISINALIATLKELFKVDGTSWSLKSDIEDMIKQLRTLTASFQGIIDTINNLKSGDFAAAAKSLSRAWNGQTAEEQMIADGPDAPRDPNAGPGFVNSPIANAIRYPWDAVTDAARWAVNGFGMNNTSPVDYAPTPSGGFKDIPGNAGSPNNTTNDNRSVSNVFNITLTGTDRAQGDELLDRIRQAQGMNDVAGAK